MTLFERWRLAVLADVAVVIAAHPPDATSSSRVWPPRRRASSSPSPSPTPHARAAGCSSSPTAAGQVWGRWPSCACCALAARSSNGVTGAQRGERGGGGRRHHPLPHRQRLPGRDGRVVARHPCRARHRWVPPVPRHEPGLVDAAVGSSRGMPDRDDDKIPLRRGDEDQPAEQDSEQSLASSHPVLLGASKVAVRGADCR